MILILTWALKCLCRYSPHLTQQNHMEKTISWIIRWMLNPLQTNWKIWIICEFFKYYCGSHIKFWLDFYNIYFLFINMIVKFHLKKFNLLITFSQVLVRRGLRWRIRYEKGINMWNQPWLRDNNDICVSMLSLVVS